MLEIQKEMYTLKFVTKKDVLMRCINVIEEHIKDVETHEDMTTMKC